MISVASLLNPTNSELRRPRPSSSPSSSIYSTPLSSYDSPLASRKIGHKHRMAKDGAIFNPGKTKGEINFPPFEDLDDGSLRETEKYHVYPLGQISQYPRHIPYNSDKKNFQEKTGRESFEDLQVFQYEFKLNGEDKTYTVMWDYNIGLVRITPFFKCCKYSKTTPAKMLNLNPGLKEITHSITGGALVAQGYWMPYSCAIAVCATFCAHISGALIPIFGPSFPSQCVPTSHQSYGAMVIEPSIIISATAEAESFRQQYSMASPSSNVIKFNSASPRELLGDIEQFGVHSPVDLAHRLRLKRTFTTASMYTTDTENSDTSISSKDQYPSSPVTPTSSYNSHGWTHENAFSMPIPKVYPPATAKRLGLRTALPSFNTESPPERTSGIDHELGATQGLPYPYGHRSTLSCGASPWLSAIPRSIASFTEDSMTVPTTRAALHQRETPESPTLRRSARNAIATMEAMRTFERETDKEYDGEDDGGESPSGSERSRYSELSDSSEGMDKKAAWLLMNLSVRDGVQGGAPTAKYPKIVAGTGILGANTIIGNADLQVHEVRPKLGGFIPYPESAPRVKRRRATSL